MIPTTDRMYMVLAMYYETEIARGGLWFEMPTTRQVAAEWGVSRPTVDHAWAVLKRDGFITTSRAGTRVSSSRAKVAAYHKNNAPSKGTS